jgi:hypothetical protein
MLSSLLSSVSFRLILFFVVCRNIMVACRALEIPIRADVAMNSSSPALQTALICIWFYYNRVSRNID